jgi:type III secretory pathway lipoprotein EscJ
MQQHRDELRALLAGSVEGLLVENVTLVVNEVAAVVPARPVTSPMEGKLRMLAVLLGTLLSVVSAGMVVMILRKRAPRRSAQVQSVRTATPPPVAKKAA